MAPPSVPLIAVVGATSTALIIPSEGLCSRRAARRARRAVTREAGRRVQKVQGGAHAHGTPRGGWGCAQAGPRGWLAEGEGDCWPGLGVTLWWGQLSPLREALQVNDDRV